MKPPLVAAKTPFLTRACAIAVLLSAALVARVAPARAADLGSAQSGSGASSPTQVATPTSEPLGKALSLGFVSGMYTALWLVCYQAWWANGTKHGFEWSDDGWFAVDTYSGGADKVGHFYATHLLTRATAGLMREGGWSLPVSALAGALGSTVTYLTFELRDAYTTGFSRRDMLANLAGTNLGVLMLYFPWLDERIDTRVQYWPSAGYLKNFHADGFNFNEDYTGLTFLLAYHLSSIKEIEAIDFPLRFVDLVVGFNTQNYRPRPVEENPLQKQHLFLGLSLNLQRVVDELWLSERHPRFGDSAGRGHRFVQFLTEFFSLPLTTAPVVRWERQHIKQSGANPGE
jgi:hypothetical protein